MNEIVLATQNPGKVAELRAILKDEDLTVLGLADLGERFDEPDENGVSFLENATIKAVAYAKMTNKTCLADDSGLIVDALDGAPGVISSHYAFDGETDSGAQLLTRAQRDAKNIDKLLGALDPFEPEERAARFVCTMVLADPDGRILASTEGAFEGRIGLPITHPHTTPSDSVPRGTNGFGYDPVFLVAPDFIQTGAELDPSTKNQISHRAQALGAMVSRIREL